VPLFPWKSLKLPAKQRFDASPLYNPGCLQWWSGFFYLQTIRAGEGFPRDRRVLHNFAQVEVAIEDAKGLSKTIRNALGIQ